MKREPVAGVDYDPDGDMCQDDYEWFTSTGQYEGNGWAEWKEGVERRKRLLCPFCGGYGCPTCYETGVLL